MTYQFSNRLISESLDFQPKDFLYSYPKFSNGQNKNSVSLSLLIAKFQQYKNLKSTNGQLNTETFRALGEEMSPLQLQMATMFQPELRYLFVGEPRDGFINRSKSEFIPAFYNLWNAHRGSDPTYIDPKTGLPPEFP